MKKYIVVTIAVIAFLAVTIPAGAESGFNEASKWIASWGKCYSKDTTQAASQPSGTVASQSSKMPATDVLGNKVPCKTMKEGKTQLGI